MLFTISINLVTKFAAKLIEKPMWWFLIFALFIPIYLYMTINKKISIEDLIDEVPNAVEYLMKQGIRCVVCGEPIWGSLEEAAIEKGFSESEINQFVKDLQNLYISAKG